MEINADLKILLCENEASQEKKLFPPASKVRVYNDAWTKTIDAGDDDCEGVIQRVQTVADGPVSVYVKDEREKILRYGSQYQATTYVNGQKTGSFIPLRYHSEYCPIGREEDGEMVYYNIKGIHRQHGYGTDHTQCECPPGFTQLMDYFGEVHCRPLQHRLVLDKRTLSTTPPILYMVDVKQRRTSEEITQERLKRLCLEGSGTYVETCTRSVDNKRWKADCEAMNGQFTGPSKFTPGQIVKVQRKGPNGETEMRNWGEVVAGGEWVRVQHDPSKYPTDDCDTCVTTHISDLTIERGNQCGVYSYDKNQCDTANRCETWPNGEGEPPILLQREAEEDCLLREFPEEWPIWFIYANQLERAYYGTDALGCKGTIADARCTMARYPLNVWDHKPTTRISDNFLVANGASIVVQSIVAYSLAQCQDTCIHHQECFQFNGGRQCFHDCKAISWKNDTQVGSWTSHTGLDCDIRQSFIKTITLSYPYDITIAQQECNQHPECFYIQDHLDGNVTMYRNCKTTALPKDSENKIWARPTQRQCTMYQDRASNKDGLEKLSSVWSLSNAGTDYWEDDTNTSSYLLKSNQEACDWHNVNPLDSEWGCCRNSTGGYGVCEDDGYALYPDNSPSSEACNGTTADAMCYLRRNLYIGYTEDSVHMNDIKSTQFSDQGGQPRQPTVQDACRHYLTTGQFDNGVETFGADALRFRMPVSGQLTIPHDWGCPCFKQRRDEATGGLCRTKTKVCDEHGTKQTNCENEKCAWTGGVQAQTTTYTGQWSPALTNFTLRGRFIHGNEDNPVLYWEPSETQLVLYEVPSALDEKCFGRALPITTVASGPGNARYNYFGGGYVRRRRIVPADDPDEQFTCERTLVQTTRTPMIITDVATDSTRQITRVTTSTSQDAYWIHADNAWSSTSTLWAPPSDNDGYIMQTIRTNIDSTIPVVNSNTRGDPLRIPNGTNFFPTEWYRLDDGTWVEAQDVTIVPNNAKQMAYSCGDLWEQTNNPSLVVSVPECADFTDDADYYPPLELKCTACPSDWVSESAREPVCRQCGASHLGPEEYVDSTTCTLCAAGETVFGWDAEKTTYRTAAQLACFTCHGTIDPTTWHCIPCPYGTQHNADADKCEQCPNDHLCATLLDVTNPYTTPFQLERVSVPVNLTNISGLHAIGGSPHDCSDWCSNGRVINITSNKPNTTRFYSVGQDATSAEVGTVVGWTNQAGITDCTYLQRCLTYCTEECDDANMCK
jgi:hypothetical protein